MSRVKKIIQQFYWLVTFFGFNWGKSYIATLVKSQKLHKMLRNLTFVVQFAYFSIRPTFEQFFEKSRETFWKISSNLWKALGAGQGFIAVGGGGGIFLLPPCLFPNHPPLLDLILIPTLDWVHLKPRWPPIRDFFQE